MGSSGTAQEAMEVLVHQGREACEEYLRLNVGVKEMIDVSFQAGAFSEAVKNVVTERVRAAERELQEKVT